MKFFPSQRFRCSVLVAKIQLHTGATDKDIIYHLAGVKEIKGFISYLPQKIKVTEKFKTSKYLQKLVQLRGGNNQKFTNNPTKNIEERVKKFLQDKVKKFVDKTIDKADQFVDKIVEKELLEVIVQNILSKYEKQIAVIVSSIQQALAKNVIEGVEKSFFILFVFIKCWTYSTLIVELSNIDIKRKQLDNSMKLRTASGYKISSAVASSIYAKRVQTLTWRKIVLILTLSLEIGIDLGSVFLPTSLQYMLIDKLNRKITFIKAVFTFFTVRALLGNNPSKYNFFLLTLISFSLTSTPIGQFSYLIAERPTNLIDSSNLDISTKNNPITLKEKNNKINNTIKTKKVSTSQNALPKPAISKEIELIHENFPKAERLKNK